MVDANIEAKVSETVKQITEEKLLQETKEAFADLDERQAKEDQTFNELLGKLNDQIKAERKVKLQKERKEAMRKAAAPFDAIEHQEQLDEAFASLLSED